MPLSPFPYSDTNKRYHTFDYFVRHAFGGKLARVALDAGLGCPNRAGGRGAGGCVFCRGGSGAALPTASVEAQYEAGLAAARRKWEIAGTIPYLQSYTNTYAAPDVLAALYARCASLPGARMLAIGTRADCLSPAVLEVLCRTAERIPLLVELGMQTACEETLRRIGRGCTHAEFLTGYNRLRRIADASGGRIRVGLHLLNFLPGEDAAQMLRNAEEAARLGPELVKLHAMCVLEGTPLAEAWRRGEYVPPDADDAAQIAAAQLTRLPGEIVIDRLAADAPRSILLAPAWVRAKRAFADAVDQLLAARGWMQGCHQ